MTAALAATLALTAPFAHAAGLSSDAKASIPHDVQQLIVVDYRAMQNSPAAMSLKDRVMPPELKRLESALVTSGLKVDADADVLAFAAFRVASPDGKGADTARIVGIAQGQFHTHDIMASWTKTKAKPLVIRNNSIYPMGATGLSVVFLNQTTMVFGDKDAIKAAVDARDGFAPNFLTDSDLVSEMTSVDSHAVWSLLDAKGTQMMMKSMLGEAAQIADYDTVKNRMGLSHYTMDFANGVKFELGVNMSDTMTAATCSTPLCGQRWKSPSWKHQCTCAARSARISASRLRSHRRSATSRSRATSPPSANSASPARCATSRTPSAARPKPPNSASPA